MEKAILKTLAYADIFDYPMKAWEIQKWLVGKKASLSQIDKGLRRLIKKGKVQFSKDYYFLKGRRTVVFRRIERARHSRRLLNWISIVAPFFKLVPWVKLTGVSGNLAMENASKNDDIDLFIVTEKNRLWISRLLITAILVLIGRRRKRGEEGRKIAGKVCVNLLLDEDNLAQQNKDIYVAHELLQMKVLWERDGIYNRFLEENEWAFKYLPNWIGATSIKQHALSTQKKKLTASRLSLAALIDLTEKLFRSLQLSYMGLPTGEEKVSDTALYFHPHDYRRSALKAYHKKLVKLSLASPKRALISFHKDLRF